MRNDIYSEVVIPVVRDIVSGTLKKVHRQEEKDDAEGYVLLQIVKVLHRRNRMPRDMRSWVGRVAKNMTIDYLRTLRDYNPQTGVRKNFVENDILATLFRRDFTRYIWEQVLPGILNSGSVEVLRRYYVERVELVKISAEFGMHRNWARHVKDRALEKIRSYLAHNPDIERQLRSVLCELVEEQEYVLNDC